MSRLGWADLGIATLDTMRNNAEMVSPNDAKGGWWAEIRCTYIVVYVLIESTVRVDC